MYAFFSLPNCYTILGEIFEKMADEYLRKMLRKGVPPAFVTMNGLYKDPEKVTIIERLLTGYLESLESVSKFSAEGKFLDQVLKLQILGLLCCMWLPDT